MWCNPPANLPLTSNEVHLWRTELDLSQEQVCTFASILSEDEKSRAERFYFERDKQRFIVGRGALRSILSRYSGIEPAQLQFEYGSRGKPKLVQGGDRLQFNLSHSQGLALYGVARHAIGVDLEYLRPMPDAEKIAQRFFCAGEYRAICAVPSNERHKAFFQIWTAKEAYLKATGDGLAGLEQVEVSLGDEPTRLIGIQGDSEAASRWTLHHLLPASNFIATIAVESCAWQIKYWHI